MSERCESCGILFAEHSGVIATCAKLATAEQECERLRAELEASRAAINAVRTQGNALNLRWWLDLPAVRAANGAKGAA